MLRSIMAYKMLVVALVAAAGIASAVRVSVLQDDIRGKMKDSGFLYRTPNLIYRSDGPRQAKLGGTVTINIKPALGPASTSSAWFSDLGSKIASKDELGDWTSLQDHHVDPSEWEAKGQNDTLRQVLFVHRHGDRTPITFPERDPLKDETFWAFHGYGQLTNKGKARLNLLGRIIRARYDIFSEGSVNKNQRISRSSSSLRCVESAQAFLSGFLALDLPHATDAQQLIWDADSQLAHLWQPASIQSTSCRIDGMLCEGSTCKELTNEYTNVIDTSVFMRNLNAKYAAEAKLLDDELGFEIDHFWKWFWAASQIEVERTYFEEKMSKKILESYRRIQDAGNLAMTAYQNTMKSRRLRSGLLINDMLNNMFLSRTLDLGSRVEAKRFVHYSSHDLNLVSLLGVLGAWERYAFRPDYGATVIMELHRDEYDWYVKFFYMPMVPHKPLEIHLSACEKDNPRGHCTLDKFANLMRPYRIDGWANWMRECGNNFETIDPYLNND